MQFPTNGALYSGMLHRKDAYSYTIKTECYLPIALVTTCKYLGICSRCVEKSFSSLITTNRCLHAGALIMGSKWTSVPAACSSNKIRNQGTDDYDKNCIYNINPFRPLALFNSIFPLFNEELLLQLSSDHDSLIQYRLFVIPQKLSRGLNLEWNPWHYRRQLIHTQGSLIPMIEGVAWTTQRFVRVR